MRCVKAYVGARANYLQTALGRTFCHQLNSDYVQVAISLNSANVDFRLFDLVI